MNTVVPYDHLIITTGTQYQVPAPTEVDVEQNITNDEVQFLSNNVASKEKIKRKRARLKKKENVCLTGFENFEKRNDKF